MRLNVMKLTLLAGVAAACLNAQQPDYRQIANAPLQLISKYQFKLAPGNVTSGSIATAGAKTLSVRPCPLGVAGANTNHYLRISGGVGTAEQVLITGGTCTSGAASGTLAFTTANTHTGSWTITSATAGIQEWFYGASTPLNGALPPGSLTLYAKTTLYGRGNGSVRITCSGNPACQLSRDSTYASGDLFHYNSGIAAGQLILDNFAIINAAAFDNPTGAGIKLDTTQPREVLMNDVTVYNGVNPIVVNGTGTAILTQVYVYIQDGYTSVPGTIGPGITLNAAITDLIDSKVWWQTKPASGGPGVKITRADGITIQGGLYSGTYGIQISPSSSHTTNFIYINDTIIDETYSHGVYVDSSSHTGQILGQIRIQNSHFATQNGDDGATGIYIGNDVAALTISGNNISGFEGPGIVLGVPNAVPRGAVISGNHINNNGRTGSRYGILISPTGTSGSGSYDANTSITGNVIGNNLALAYGSSTQEIGIYFLGSAGKFRGYEISGNVLQGNSAGAIIKDATPTVEGFSLGSNVGVSDTIAVVASGSLSAANAAAMYRNIEVSGTTNVTSLTPVWDGRIITFLKSDAGTVNFTAAGNIAASASIAQNGMLICQYYAAYTKWICK